MAPQTRNERWGNAPKYAAGALIGTLVFVVLPETARWLHGGAFAQVPTAGGVVVAQNSVSTITNNQGIITQGQTGGTNLIVPKPPPREIDDEFRNFIRQNFSDKSKEMATTVLVGDDEPERSHFASEIENFLRADGYKVKPRTYFLAVGDTPNGIVIDKYSDPNAILIKVGVNNRR